jgi:diguanylate cyclase (GGDEF)-like protein
MENIKKQALQVQVDSFRLHLLVSAGPSAIIISSTIGVLILIFLLSGVIQQVMLSTWAVLIVVIAVARILLIRKISRVLLQNNQSLSQAQIKHYETIYCLGAFLGGLSLGGLGALIDGSWPIGIQFTIPFLLAGLSAAAVSSNSSSLPSYYCFIFPTLLPLVYGLYKIDSWFAAIIVLVYLIMVIATSKRFNTVIVKNIFLRFENEELIDRLKESDRTQTHLLMQKEEQHKTLQRMAHYDVLTNLPNRGLLADRLNQAMMQSQRRKQPLAVAFMDLDGFKTINDSYGHTVGDELLIVLSKRMKEALREGDTLARIGGDEFIAVMVDLEKIEDSEPLLERLLKAASSPVILNNISMQVSASIGVTLYPQDGEDADRLMRHADQAMYVAKQAGKNRYHLFDTVHDNAIKIQRQSIGDISSAIERREFVLHYQPKVNMRTGEVMGAEALIRWQHPDRGIVPPLEFLPAIEGHAVSLELGEWVIDTALSQISQWQNLAIYLPVSVNISAYQLTQENFSDRLRALLAGHRDVNPRNLELEILETSALSDISQVSATMKECHELGVSFALDDFGTGYSSLTYLKRLPAYLIKIDQSFVRDMLEDADDLAIIEGVVGLAKAFQRKVIAEGVETVAHGEALLKMGCELAQGYGIARPMPAADIPEWVSTWKPDDAWKV